MGFLNVIKKQFKKNLKEASAINVNNYKKFLVKAVGLFSGEGAGRDNLISPEYDFNEIREAAKADSYIRMSLLKYSYMLFKAGYFLKGENEKAIDYIKKRFNIMSFATSKPIDIVFQEIGDDLTKYSNAFLAKSMVSDIMPGIKAKGVFSDKVVGGYYRLDPATISISKGDNGDIKNYVQSVNGKEKKFNKNDIIHFYLDKESDNSFGTPRIIAALEDVKLLRRIEGNVVSMIHRFAMPLFQWKIGLPVAGFQATDKEIDQITNEVNAMSLDGVVITNEKTDIKVIGAEGNALNAEGYLKYFEQRVFSALGVSESQMGRGGSKQDADSMESQAHDIVKHVQRIFSIIIEYGVINELLLEGGFNPILNEDDQIKFIFNEINTDTKIKVENHEMLKYQSNMTTFTEMRKSLGLKETTDVKELYKNMIEVEAESKIAKIKADMLIKVSKEKDSSSQNPTENSKGISPIGNGKTKNEDTKQIEYNNRPENQHGRTSVKVKESLSDMDLNEKTIRSYNKHKKSFINIYNKYEKLCNDILTTDTDKDILIPLAYTNILESIKLNIQMYSVQGIEQATLDIRKMKKTFNTFSNVQISTSIFEEMASDSLKKTFTAIEEKIKKNNDPIYIKSVFETFEYRIRFMLEYILPKTYWYSYLKAGEAFGIDKAYVNFGDSKDAEKYPNKIDVKNINIDEIPPYHPFCDCKIYFKAGDK